MHGEDGACQAVECACIAFVDEEDEGGDRSVDG
jgi:hypothetical protein